MVETHTDVRAETLASLASRREECLGVADTLSRIGDKWTIMVIGALSFGTLRYSELHRLVGGISQRMLTLTLKGLEQDGLVSRTVYPTIPPRVEYDLTELGRGLGVPLKGLHDWAVQHRQDMLDARARYQSAQVGQHTTAAAGSARHGSSLASQH